MFDMNSSAWLRLWGLDPKTGLPLVWKMWWPWLDIKQTQVSVSFDVSPAMPQSVAKKVESIEATSVQRELESKIPQHVIAHDEVKKTSTRVKSIDSNSQKAVEAATPTIAAVAKQVIDENKEAVKSKPRRSPKTTSSAVKTTTVSQAIKQKKPAQHDLLKELEVNPKQSTLVKEVSKDVQSNTVETITDKKMPAAHSSVFSNGVQQQIDQLGAMPTKEALRSVIRAVYAEKGMAEPEQWGKWLHQNADSLNTLHLQPMAAAGEIQLAVKKNK